MTKSPKTWQRYGTAGGLVVASVALGAAGAAAAPAIAATASPSATPSTAPGAATPAAGDMGRGRGGPGARPATVASVLGVTEVQLRSQLEAGKTLAQVAAVKDISKATLISRLVAAEKTAIGADVKSGRITQSEADTRLSGLQARVTAQVDEVRPAGGPGGRGPGGGPAGGPADGPGRGGPGVRPATVASVLGVTEVQLRSQLEAGKTLAQVAAAKDISKATLTAKLVAAEKAAIGADVKAGRITQSEADTRLSGLQARVTTQVDEVRIGRTGPTGTSPTSVPTPSASAAA